MVIKFHNQTNEKVDAIKTLIKRIFKNINEVKNMQVIFVSATDMKQINHTYRGIDKVTDVISFPNDEVDDDSLGDIFISLEQAANQAATYGHSYEREVGFLAVHGYLHLKGYDHDTKEKEKEMFAKQEEILLAANLKRE